MGNDTAVDDELARGLKLAKSKRCRFAFVVKGGNDGALIVSKQKVPPAQIAAAKKRCGGSAVVRGAVFFEEGVHIFETAKPPAATWAKAIKVLAKRDSGLAIRVECRQGTDPDLLDEIEGEGGEQDAATAAPSAAAPPDAPPVPPPAGADAVKRLNSMGAAIKAALAGPNKAQVQSLFAAASGSIKSKDFDQANSALDELQSLIASANQAPAAPPQAALDAGGLMQRLNGMAADIKTALAGPNKAQVQSLFAAASGLIKNKDITQAAKVLDQLAGLLGQAQPAQAQSATPNAAAATSAPTPDGLRQKDAALVATWEKRIAQLEPRVLEAQKTRPTEAKWMTVFMTAQDTAAQGALAKALAILDRLEAALDAPPKQQGQAKPALARWNAVRTAVVAQLNEEIKLVGASQHPDAGQAQLELRAVVAQLSGDLTTSEEATVMQSYLKDDGVVADICENAFDLKTPLLNVLAEIIPQLSA